MERVAFEYTGNLPVGDQRDQDPQKSEAFQDYLDQANDPVLTDSSRITFIVGMRGSFVLSPPDTRRRNTFFSRMTWNGPGTRCSFRFKPSLFKPRIPRPSTSTIPLRALRYAEFVKIDSDLRWHRVVNDKSSFAFRAAAGAGLPYGNLTVLPFESSFFVGGGNGLRAWRARSIGPGSYSAPLLAFDPIGELKLEGNAEYRFKLVGFLEGAFFADVGNIWNIMRIRANQAVGSPRIF